MYFLNFNPRVEKVPAPVAIIIALAFVPALLLTLLYMKYETTIRKYVSRKGEYV
jgi:hypothetical protein